MYIMMHGSGNVKNAQFCVLCISLLIGCYIVRRSCHPQGFYSTVVKTYRITTVLQWSCLSNVQV